MIKLEKQARRKAGNCNYCTLTNTRTVLCMNGPDGFQSRICFTCLKEMKDWLRDMQHNAHAPSEDDLQLIND